MSRKDFEIIACILSYTEIKDKESITTLLKTTNPRFDENKFWEKVRKYQNGII